MNNVKLKNKSTPDDSELNPVFSTVLDSSGSQETAMRMLIYSHDTFGLGHIQRSLKISRAMVSQYGNLSILIVTGSPVAHRIKFPSRVDYIKLPSVRKIGVNKYQARSLNMSFERVLELRSNIILNAVQGYEPHIFLADHSPIGMKGELLLTLEWLQNSSKNTVKLIGLRDIIDAPEVVTEAWEKQGIYDILERMYDHILIYGTKRVFNPVEAYRFTSILRQKSTFCNYICAEQTEEKDSSSSKGEPEKRPLVVVSTGGGDGAGETVIGNYLEMLKVFEAEINFDSTIVTGPFMSKELYCDFLNAAKDLPVTLKKYVSSMPALYRHSDLVVSTGGYNTITDLLCSAKRALIIPRVMHRKEQLMRAERLAELGLLNYLLPDQVTPQSLMEVVKSMLSSSEKPLSDAREKDVIPLDGATRLAEFCGGLSQFRLQLQRRHNE